MSLEEQPTWQEVTDPDILRVAGLVAAAENEANGAMIALVPSDADLDRLALDPDVEGAESRDTLHLTLWFLGQAGDWEPERRQEMVNHVESSVAELGPVQARAFGANFWNPDSDTPSWNLAIGDDPEAEGSETMSNVQHMVSPRRMEGPQDLQLPDQHSPWVPHICLAYTSENLAEQVASRTGPITFDKVRVAFGGDTTDIPLGGMVAGGHGGTSVKPWDNQWLRRIFDRRT